jgi:hypothetical protein
MVKKVKVRHQPVNFKFEENVNGTVHILISYCRLYAVVQ